DQSQLQDVREEMLDRFGPLPAPVDTLLLLKELQLLAREIKLDSIRIEGQFFVLTGKSARNMKLLNRLSPHDLRLVDKHNIYVPIPTEGSFDTPEGQTLLLLFLKSVLQDR
ncbi:MAG: hypothetical protein KDA78_03160, partial [Planctomycetaceae bacterium]|nr:hypothetical protein [Planctomycetaceae bacterium]